MNNTISIIITTYKGTNSIENAVVSVLNQTYPNIEIIVVDDNGLGSTAQVETEKILRKYIDEKRINYITHKINMNGSVARNTGVSYAKGTYLAFLDDDDVYLPKKLECQLRMMLKTKADMVVCGGFFVNLEGKGYVSSFRKKGDILTNYLTEKLLFNTSALLINKKTYISQNGFDPTFRRHQDWEFCSRIILKNKVEFLNIPLFIKYSFQRNVASNPSQAEKYIEYFFERLSPYLTKINNNNYQKICNYQYLRICKAYLSCRDIPNAKRVLQNTSYKYKIIHLLNSYVCHVFRKVFSGCKKRTISYYDYCCQKGNFNERIFQ